MIFCNVTLETMNPTYISSYASSVKEIFVLKSIMLHIAVVRPSGKEAMHSNGLSK